MNKKTIYLILVLSALASILLTGCGPMTAVKDDQGKTTEWNGAEKEIEVKAGDSFQYWSYSAQEWISFSVNAQGKLVIPLDTEIVDDPSYFNSNQEHTYTMLKRGNATLFWIEDKGTSFKISTPERRLKK